MIQVSLDTSFLISFADPDRSNHAVAVEYFRHCLAQRFPMWISTVAAGEFEVKQPISDLPLQNFRIQPYNLPHAIRAAAMFRSLSEENAASTEDTRRIIINDLKIIAQAEEEQISIILTEDTNTLARIAARLRQRNTCSVHVLLLTDGFSPGKLENPDQGEFTIPPTST
ncbi:MAG: PIN domain-containing protein [Verrucomicrobiales bacterium]|nr:PIN domain-containing protein [Verrucomicrobiales bacterium]